MISREEFNFNGIDDLINQQHSFALYRLPEAKEPTIVLQEGNDAVALKDYADLNGRKGFVFAPFRVKDTSPLLLIRPDIVVTGWESVLSCSPEHLQKTESSFIESEKELYKRYSDTFDLFIRPLREGIFEKIVLSRKVPISKGKSFSPEVVFYQACKQYPKAFVYLCHTPQSGVWLGSTPELLLSGESGNWHTVALAGTQSLIDNHLPDKWCDKNKKEQALVADYIKNQLATLGVVPSVDGPYGIQAGGLAHLKTDFYFNLSDKCLGDIVELLHPTPAICGLPQKETFRFIEENEGFDRLYYSGFLGKIDPDGKNDLYVNLRCMQIEKDVLTLYAGGGLLLSSVVDQEWEETKSKLQTMLALFK